jgi:hypothetical protein
VWVPLSVSRNVQWRSSAQRQLPSLRLRLRLLHQLQVLPTLFLLCLPTVAVEW